MTVLEINMLRYNCLCSEADEIYKICSVIGSPTTESWADGLQLARDINYEFPQVSFSYLGLSVSGDQLWGSQLLFNVLGVTCGS